jgi:two-component system sensor histidine kinase BaeS
MGRRLAVAFALVALLAIGVLGAVTWIETRSQVSDLVRSRNATTGQEVAAALGDAYQAAGSWQQADLRSAILLAAASGASLSVLDSSGQTVHGGLGRGAGRGGFGRGMMGMGVAASGPLGSPQQLAVTASGERVGTAVLRYPQATPAPEQQVRSALGRTVLWGGALAAGLAAAIGLLVAGRITRPLRRLTRAARSVAAGDRSARAGAGREPAELGELGLAFDRMAATIEREDALRRAFAADVAHELRTPLAIAQGELEELLDGIAQPTAERLSSLHEEMLRLGRIVRDVETLAAAQAAQFRLERHRVDLAAIAKDTVARLQPQADAAGLQLTTRLAPTAIDIDRPRMEQVAHNLLANALKFTPAGGTVTVSVASVNGDARLIVEDTGPGLSEEELAHIFERFWRGPTARDTEGSGVGLAVVAALVRAHGGQIEAANRPSGGARFTVTLPHA